MRNKNDSYADSSAGPASRPVLYEPFYGFTHRPFSLTPDPAFILWAPQYQRAFSVLEFGIFSHAPITLITGEIGCGKTTLLRALLKQLDDSVRVGLISNAQGGRGELIQWVLNALDQQFAAEDSYVRLFQRLQDFLLTEYASGRRVVLVFDEAQNLSTETLEELRMLTNINSEKDEVLQLVLVGQPELRDIVRLPSLEQLAQRISVSFHLKPLNVETAREFIAHRLRVAGGSGEEIAPECAAEIHRVSRGVPRLINQFCDMALLYAWSIKEKTVSPEIVQMILDDGVFFAAERQSEAMSVESEDNTQKEERSS